MKLAITALFITLCAITNAQNKGFDELSRAYQSFEFPKVILMADRLLAEDENLPDSLKVEIFLMKAVANYSLDQEDEVRSSFIEILKLNENYEIDPSKISPKIISLFDKVKREYKQITTGNLQNEQTAIDSMQFVKYPVFDPDKMITEARIRSVIFPGWGYFHIDQSTKGFVFSGLGAALLASSTYFIIDTINKEEDYQNETDVNLIQSKYNDYNDSYKTRNILLLSYAALLIYTQIDLSFTELVPPQTLSFSPNYNFKQNSLSINLTVQF